MFYWLLVKVEGMQVGSLSRNANNQLYETFWEGLRIRIRIIFEVGSGSGSVSALKWKVGYGSTLKSKSRSFKGQNGAVGGRERSQWRRFEGSKRESVQYLGQWSQIRI